MGIDVGLYDASNAIDGNADGNITHGSCTLTKSEYESWWKVIFNELVVVKEVTITTCVYNGKSHISCDIIMHCQHGVGVPWCH